MKKDSIDYPFREILERVFALYLLLILRKRIKLRDHSSHFSHFQGKSSHLRAL